MAEQKKEVVVKKPPIETASWCYRYCYQYDGLGSVSYRGVVARSGSV